MSIQEILRDTRNHKSDKEGNIAFTDPAFFEKRTLTASNFPSAGALIATQNNTALAALRPYNLALSAGARLTIASANQTTPQVSTGAVGNWLPVGTAAPASDMTVKQTAQTPKRVVAAGEYSKQLLIQSPTAWDIVKEDLFNALGASLAVGIFSGVGGVEPIGIFNNSEIPTVTYGGAPTLAKACEQEKALADAFAEQPGASLAWIGSPAVRSKWRQTPSIVGGYTPLWSNDGRVLGRAAYAFAGMSSNQVAFGNWADYEITLFGSPEIIVNPFSLAESGRVSITATIYADAAPLRPQSFVISSDSAAV